MTWDQILRAFMLAGFDRREQREFLSAWDADAADLTEYGTELIARFYTAAAADPEDCTSAILAQFADGHSRLLGALREVA